MNTKMSYQFFNPFANLFFDDTTCFLTGASLTETLDTVSVFPDWILDQYDYREKRFKMMDFVTSVNYQDLRLTCTPEVKQAIEALDEEVRSAMEQGFEGIAAFNPHRLFLWMGRIVYGILYHDMLFEKKAKTLQKKPFMISEKLKQRLGLFHLMLQSLVAPLQFKGAYPWSISVVRLKYSKEVFNYKDDTIQLMFALGMNGFGIIACLQDNGFVKQEHKNLLEKIGSTILHPIQFEELCARYFYYNYLLRPQPPYKIEPTSEGMSLETVSLPPDEHHKLFGKWDDQIFAKVLTDYWAPWGLTRKQIHDFPNPPISFLENSQTYEFIQPDTILLPF